MTTCQFFLQGRCRFGQNCRYEHSYGNDDRNARNTLNSQQLSTIVKKVAEAVILAEKGGQWPLSCFSPLKEGPNIPGWEDYSPEEIRWKMYEARANGTLNQATLEVNQLYRNAEKMRNLIKEPTMERVNIIANLLKGKSEPANMSNPFTSMSSSSNIFGGSAQSSTSQSIFGGGGTTTGSQANIFGGSSQSTGSVFGNTSSFSKQNIFGNVTSGAFSQNFVSKIQNSNPPMSGSGNIFGGSTMSNQNIFGGSGGTTNQSISNPFSSQNSSGIFSNTSSNSIFGSNKNENQSFSPFQSENIFKSQNSFGSTNVFGSQGSQPQATKNIFGSVSQGNAFGGSQPVLNEFDSSIYSKLEDLNEEEIKAFTSTTFAFGKIPLKPPPLKYCK